MNEKSAVSPVSFSLTTFPSLHLITSLFGSEVSERHVKREGDIMTEGDEWNGTWVREAGWGVMVG